MAPSLGSDLGDESDLGEESGLGEEMDPWLITPMFGSTSPNVLIHFPSILSHCLDVEQGSLMFR